MAFKMKGMNFGKGTGSAFPNVGNTEYGPKSAVFQKIDDKKKIPLPPDPDREDGGFETDEEYKKWLKEHNITETDVKKANQKKNLPKGKQGGGNSDTYGYGSGNYDEVD
tara:strand:- start:94 stop:420 length:327 start_codon:yes stop_codon:yes gene_type:complete